MIQYFLTKQIKFCPAIHLPFDEFDTIYMAFAPTITPAMKQSIFNRLPIRPQLNSAIIVKCHLVAADCIRCDERSVGPSGVFLTRMRQHKRNEMKVDFFSKLILLNGLPQSTCNCFSGGSSSTDSYSRNASFYSI